MDARSVALRTTLMIQRIYGRVEDRRGYAVLRTPLVPDYWYGNCLAMPGPPKAGDYATWMRLFESELPGKEHRVFLLDGIDGDAGDSSEFIENGFEACCHDVLSTRAPRRPERVCEGFEFRKFSSAADWAAGVEVSLVVNEGGPGHDRGYVERSFAATRGAVEAGRGQWWGAWADGRLAAQMGLFREGGLVRFKDVETHPDFRRRGVCRSLLYRACVEARRDMSSPEFVIVPEDDGVRRIYEAVGFVSRERTVDYCREPPSSPA